jgi:hypothetical protein
MPQNELLLTALQGDLAFLQNNLADMSDADLVQRPVPKANTGLWQLGHLIVTEAHMVNQCAGKTVIELPAGFADRYKRETASVDDPAKLGTKAELLALLQKVRGQTCQWLAALSAADMSKPAPESMRKMFPTVGNLAYLLPCHSAMHLGQIQVLRRKLGKPVLF